jgi:hypothetical protein
MNSPLPAFRIFSVGLLLSIILLGEAHSEILVYKLNGGSAKGKKIDDGQTSSSWPGIPKTFDAYLVLDFNGIDASNDERQITYLGKTFYPTQANFDHKNRTKQAYGGLFPSIGYDVYGRSYGSDRKRVFTWLHLQRDGKASADGAHDSGAGIGQGLASWLDIGTGRSGYYAMKMSFQIWRIDGGFSDTFATTQDGRQTKYASATLNLDLASTKSINQRGFDQADAVLWLLSNLNPSYTELTPDVEGE